MLFGMARLASLVLKRIEGIATTALTVLVHSHRTTRQRWDAALAVMQICMTAKAASQRWRVVRCEWTSTVKAVVAIPSIRLSTSEARRAMPKSIPVSDAVVNLGALTLLLQGLRTGNGDLISDGMHDRLHELVEAIVHAI